jgi:hypothetical protein
MRSFKLFVLCSALATALACGSSTPSNSGGNTTICDPVAFAMLNVAGSNAKLCAAIPACIADNCAATAKECAGPDYASGVYAGTCASYFACVKACKCDKTCVNACTPDSLDCASCVSSKLGMGCTLTCSSAIASCGT